MKIFALLLALVASSICLHSQLNTHQEQQQQAPILGGYRKREPNSEDKKIDDFIRNQLPQLKGARLTSVQVQVVNGWNYKFEYNKQQKNWVVTVYEGIDEQNLQLMGIQKEETARDENGNVKKLKSSVKKQNQGIVEVGQNLFRS